MQLPIPFLDAMVFIYVILLKQFATRGTPSPSCTRRPSSSHSPLIINPSIRALRDLSFPSLVVPNSELTIDSPQCHGVSHPPATSRHRGPWAMPRSVHSSESSTWDHPTHFFSLTGTLPVPGCHLMIPSRRERRVYKEVMRPSECSLLSVRLLYASPGGALTSSHHETAATAPL